MPLSPAEVHNVAFKKSPIGKRGYDEEEVDAFLDLVEAELARLIEENNDLRSAGGAGEPAAARQTVADGAEDDELATVREENGRLRQQLAETEQALADSREQLEQAHVNVAGGQPDGPANLSKQTAPAPAEHHQQAVQMLALAQQTADQHLAQAKAEAERLVNEARANADATVTDANDKAGRQLADAEARAKQLNDESAASAAKTVHDAEQRAATITAQFEQRKVGLERQVEELRTFEREYRSRLKSYLQSQLRDLDAGGSAETSKTSGEFADAQKG